MNKYQEALDELNRMAYGDCMGDEHIARIHSRKILQELVDKEIPMKVKEYKYEGHCPKCDSMNGDLNDSEHFNYCWNCGQKLNWSKE